MVRLVGMCVDFPLREVIPAFQITSVRLITSSHLQAALRGGL